MFIEKAYKGWQQRSSGGACVLTLRFSNRNQPSRQPHGCTDMKEQTPGVPALRRYFPFLLGIFLFTLCAKPVRSQEGGDSVADAVAEGNEFLKQKDFDKALGAFRKADKLSHHTCVDCFLGMFSADRERGDLQAALDDGKAAVKAAGNDQAKAAQAHLVRSTLLTQMAAKPNDKKLREAEWEVHQALDLAPGLTISHFDLGKILIRQERDSEGIVELKNYVATPGADPKLVLEARRIIANPIRGREPFAPDFSFVSLEGERLSNAALRGKVVLFDFWGAWCGPCRETLPVLLNIRKKYRDRPFQIVGVSSDEDEQLWKGFIASYHIDWPEYLDRSSAVQEAFEINSFPTFIVLDRDGIITYSQSGWDPILAMELEEAINKALKRPSNPAVLLAASASVPEEPAPGPRPDANLAGTQKLAPNSPGTGSAVEGGVISGGVYRDERLGFSYQFPSNWVAAAPEVVRAAMDKAQGDARAKFLEQHPEKGDPLKIVFPTIVFYASQTDRGDGLRLSFPCVRISVTPWTRSAATLNEVEASAERSLPPGTILSRAPVEYTANGQPFLRADLVNSSGTRRVCMSRIMTITHGHLLALELFATDQPELERLISTATIKMLATP